MIIKEINSLFIIIVLVNLCSDFAKLADVEGLL